MEVINSPQKLQAKSVEWKRQGNVALIPTMGALHEGHLGLVRHARSMAKYTVVSIFVNPLQFGPNEDFEKYPRTFEQDLELLRPLGVDAVFAPWATQFYPPGFSTRVAVSNLSEHLCGKSRPHFFGGVATVCLKLFQSAMPDVAVFGEKDFQQLRILETLVSDLNLPMSIVRHPTVREPDGVALSSRNRYLSEFEREWARRIPDTGRILRQKGGDATVGELLQTARENLTSVPLAIDYCEIASEIDLVPVSSDRRLSEISKPRLFMAVKAGETRLIDNFSLSDRTR